MDKLMILVNAVIYGVKDIAERMFEFLTVPFIFSPTKILPPGLASSETFETIWFTIMDFLGFVDLNNGFTNEISTIEVLVGSSILIIIFLQIVKFIKEIIF